MKTWWDTFDGIALLDGVLLEEALGGSLDHDEELGGCLDHDEALEGFCGLLDALLVLPIPSIVGGQALNEAPFAQTT